MNMQDLAIAKNRLNEKSLTLCIAKNGEIIFETSLPKISGFFDALENFREQLEGASVADRVVGKAIALLCVFAKVKAVYARTLGKKAEAVLEENAVYHEWENLVDNVLAVDKAGICPFERLASEISDPKVAYEKLKVLQTSLATCQ
jgi:hypothetical protein